MTARSVKLGCLAMLLVVAATFTPAFGGGGKKKACCPKCNTCCELKVEEGTEEKHCWKLEPKVVCIPRVTFSWQWPWEKKAKCAQTCDAGCKKPCCAPPKLARTRTVCTLVKHTYECPTCEYKWIPKEATNCASVTAEELEMTAASVKQPAVVK